MPYVLIVGAVLVRCGQRCIHVRMSVRVRASLGLCLGVRARVCVRVRVCICVYVRMHGCTIV